jgi:hypothetical protein
MCEERKATVEAEMVGATFPIGTISSNAVSNGENEVAL